MAEGVINEIDTLDEIIFIPSADPPHKNKHELANFSDRFKMVQAAIQDNSYFSCSDIENRLQGKSYSIRTIKYFRENYDLEKDELYFLIGEDSLNDLADWKSPAEIVSLCNLIVVARRASNKKEYTKENKFYKEVQFVENVPFIDISSTMIRKQIQKNKSIRYLVPETVNHYISAKKMYI